jgi:acyl-CoA thioester hydrolase
VAEQFTKQFHVRWGDMDFNAHMSNTAYLDVSADVRMMYFQEHGFPMREFERLRVGPVITRDELEYFRELRLLEPVNVSLTLAGLSDSASFFRLTNEFFTGENKLAARVTSMGGWLDLAARKLTAPPEALAALLRGIPKTPNFEVLPLKL